MQDQNAQPTPEQKTAVLVDDTKAPVDPELEVKPKSSCRHCYGRGYIGTDTHTKKKILCRCVQKSFAKAEKVRNARKAEEMKLKPSQITKDMGWERPKATPINTTVVSTK